MSIVQMKGGARILAYELAVILGSIPFIAFITWRAQVVGLTKKNAFLIALLLCGDIMLFPWALRSGWIIIWIISIIILIISGTLWSEVQKIIMKRKISTFKIKSCADKQNIEGPITPIQVNPLETPDIHETIGSSEAACPADILKTEVIPLDKSIDELIDLGFKEKNSENFELAAAYFTQALSLDPLPDLAFYLIIDCYWLWNNLGKRSYALTQLQVYVQKYLPLFNLQLCDQFKAWMTKEDLYKMFD